MDAYNNWYEEKRSAYLYRVMANHEQNILYKKLFRDLNLAAEKQAAIWGKTLQEAGLSPVFKPDLRTKLVAWLIKIMGAERLHNILSAMKIRGMSVYTRYHQEHQHTSLNASSNLRAAVFGVNDGLISNMSLLLGVAGAGSQPHFIILAGIAGLLAGASSMAAGEYISVRSQREVFEHQIAIEQKELEEYPEEEIEELSLIYQAKGVPKEEAEKLAQIMIGNPETGLNTLVREELGLNPEDLVSPFGAMFSSFIAFAVGAIIPLLPYLLGGNHAWNLEISMGLTGISLIIIGSTLSLFTNKNPILSGLRMLVIGAVAGMASYGIGALIGTSGG